ncbi:MAG: phosphocholine cytidylyltransferase family protein [Candidatus Omnitrophica bacterium]|nr:phosphocholine cytidylyltransferase family protein [Candidatus Omnitrophota bacterium]
MTAVILAAGVGKRMGAGALPKTLSVVAGQSLLRRMLESLQAAGVRRVVLVVGYRKEEVVEEARRYAGRMELSVIENPRFREGAILSLWSARDVFSDDLLIMDSDVFFPPAFIQKLVASAHRNCILVDGTSPDTGEEQIVLGIGERVFHITKRPTDQQKSDWIPFGESVGFLKLEEAAAGTLKVLLDEKVQAGIVNIEHEQVYPELFKRFHVGFEKVDGFAWTEIDTPEDLVRAKEEIYPRWNRSVCLNRRLSGALLPFVLKLPLRPNHWTSLSLLSGLAALLQFSRGDYASGIWGAFLFQLFYLIDNWDGDVARAKGLMSTWGGWFDVAADGIVQLLLPLALAAGLVQRGWDMSVYAWGWVGTAGIALSFAATSFAKTRGFGPSVYEDRGRTGAVRPGRWRESLRANLTNENFSLVVMALFLLDWRFLFLVLSALGSNFFWISFLWKERRRLFRRPHSFAHARL